MHSRIFKEGDHKYNRDELMIIHLIALLKCEESLERMRIYMDIDDAEADIDVLEDYSISENFQDMYWGKDRANIMCYFTHPENISYCSDDITWVFERDSNKFGFVDVNPNLYVMISPSIPVGVNIGSVRLNNPIK